ncbi:MAG: Npt1/Npt2 family nucleotide transporter [Planctomycetota bacterium]|nr:Npt1/Npt2 family nucleotide transporter [Planctomycetota bacterium]
MDRSSDANAPRPSSSARPPGRFRLFDLRPGEFALVAWSCAYFFFVLSSYYCIRPVRDAFGLSGDDTELRWLFRTTLVVMIAVNPAFSWLVARFPRRVFIPASYLFFAANLLVFFLLFAATREGEAVAVRRIFYVWVSVFNLFVVSVFWAFMADLFSVEQSKRLYGLIAVGGTMGAVIGAGFPWLLAERLGAIIMLPISITLLLLACLCMLRLNRLSMRRRATSSAAGAGDADADAPQPPDRAIGGSPLAGVTHFLRSPYLLGIGAFILFYTVLSTLLYFVQADIVREAFDDRAARTAFFGKVDVFVNTLTALIQIFLTGRIMRTFGVGLTLGLLPVVYLIGFSALALAMAPATAGLLSALNVIVMFQVGRRAANYALARPARESLFTVVKREEKYKAKNLIDTFVYRAGDAIGTIPLSWLAIPLAVVWFVLSLGLGRRQRQLSAARQTTG